jgi:hypothetical protein
MPVELQQRVHEEVEGPISGAAGRRGVRSVRWAFRGQAITAGARRRRRACEMG